MRHHQILHKAHHTPNILFLGGMLFSMFVLFVACKGNDARSIDEKEGARQLSQAREAFYRHHYDEARDSIMSLRKNHPLALDARRQAILLLDSIELFAARDSFDALNQLAQQQYMECLDNPDAPLRLDSATYVDEHERLDMKVQFFERKLVEDKKGTASDEVEAR